MSRKVSVRTRGQVSRVLQSILRIRRPDARDNAIGMRGIHNPPEEPGLWVRNQKHSLSSEAQSYH